MLCWFKCAEIFFEVFQSFECLLYGPLCVAKETPVLVFEWHLPFGFKAGVNPQFANKYHENWLADEVVFRIWISAGIFQI